MKEMEISSDGEDVEIARIISVEIKNISLRTDVHNVSMKLILTNLSL